MTDATHVQVSISRNGFAADVDEGIAALLLECWEAGLETTQSCQDIGGRVWIQFMFSDDAERFLSIAAGAFDQEAGSLYNRVGGDSRAIGDAGPASAWSYTPHVVDVAVEVDDTGRAVRAQGDGPVMHVMLSVRFPISDYPDVLERLRVNNETPSPGFAGHRDRRRRAVVEGRPRRPA